LIGDPLNGHVVGAPMVGTFYSAASPSSPPFVETGDAVREGDTLCIIESMKMMNYVKAEQAGKIEAILVVNEEPVEFDQPLFTIS
ncbi:MAG TPA: acetyl-CoA carboxylase biotin carboxyl carrier protein, partial [Pseudomonadales bacterium]|nr:acetyl-CoA carboxylase biotin carboxyl carrier protein [Pseudomonadales bacterium]